MIVASGNLNLKEEKERWWGKGNVFVASVRLVKRGGVPEILFFIVVYLMDEVGIGRFVEWNSIPFLHPPPFKKTIASKREEGGDHLLFLAVRVMTPVSSPTTASAIFILVPSVRVFSTTVLHDTTLSTKLCPCVPGCKDPTVTTFSARS